MNGFEAYAKLADKEGWGPMGWACTHCREEVARYYAVLASGCVPGTDQWCSACDTERARGEVRDLSTHEREALAGLLESLDVRRFAGANGRRWRLHLAVALEAVRADEKLSKRVTLAWVPQLLELLGHEVAAWDEPRRNLGGVIASGRCLIAEDVLSLPFPPEPTSRAHEA